MIDKPILGLLTFGSNPDFGSEAEILNIFDHFLAASAAQKLHKKVVIQSAASAAWEPALAADLIIA